jgi:hypothetical protein
MSLFSGRTRRGEHKPSKLQEQHMMLKQISLAALAAIFLTGSAAVVQAEISNGGGSPSPTSSAGLENDWAARQMVMSPHSAYGYVAVDRSHQHHRYVAGVRHY